jgi:chemotaxis protein methyltransferase CheR
MSRRPTDVDARIDPESIEIECFLLALYRRYGYDLRGYDPAVVRRLILRRAREEEAGSVSQLAGQLLREPALLERFLAQVSPPGEGLFRPPEFWTSSRRNVVPLLRTYPTVRAWLPGARAEELITLSIVLDEDLPRRVRIYATDIHEALLTRAREGAIPTGALTAADRGYRRSGGKGSLRRYFQADNGTAVLSPELRRRIVFAAHNPVTDGSFQQCHAVLARSGLALLSGELRDRLYRLLHASLVPLGFLALGPKDDLAASPVADRYRAVDRAANLHQKMRD